MTWGVVAPTSLACVLAINAVAGQAGGAIVANPSQPSSVLAAELRAVFERRLEAIAHGLDGVLGYAVLDLPSGAAVAARLDAEPFPAASTIKLAILYELMTQADEGRLRLDQPIALDPANVVGGSGVLQHLSRPTLTLRDHAALMIIVSDNTATNVVIDAVGMPSVAMRVRALGVPDVRLRRKMQDAAAARRGDENVASPASLAKLAAMLWKGDGLSPSSRDLAHAVLRPVSGAIRGVVPPDVKVLSKTGTLAGMRAEAAVIELEGRPFALAVMATHLEDDADGDRAIRDVASAAFDYMYRLAKGGQYGRR